MQIRAEEISAIIKEKIKGFDKQVDVKETGSVIQVREDSRECGVRARAGASAPQTIGVFMRGIRQPRRIERPDRSEFQEERFG